jgi:hypothetical protein
LAEASKVPAPGAPTPADAIARPLTEPLDEKPHWHDTPDS